MHDTRDENAKTDPLPRGWSMAQDENPKCPTCSKPLIYVNDPPVEASSFGDKISVKFASSIYRCPEHGLWRFYINGEVEPYSG